MTVIFDMDGILLDTEKVSRRSWKAQEQRFHIKNIDKVLEAVRMFISDCHDWQRRARIFPMRISCGRLTSRSWRSSAARVSR